MHCQNIKMEPRIRDFCAFALEEARKRNLVIVHRKFSDSEYYSVGTGLSFERDHINPDEIEGLEVVEDCVIVFTEA